MLAQAERLREDLGAYAGGAAGQIHFLSNTNAMTEFLPEALSSFLSIHPHVSVDLEERLSDEIVGLIAEGGADIGIVAGTVETARCRPFRSTTTASCWSSAKNHSLAGLENIAFHRSARPRFRRPRPCERLAALSHRQGGAGRETVSAPGTAEKASTPFAALWSAMSASASCRKRSARRAARSMAIKRVELTDFLGGARSQDLRAQPEKPAALRAAARRASAARRPDAHDFLTHIRHAGAAIPACICRVYFLLTNQRTNERQGFFVRRSLATSRFLKPSDSPRLTAMAKLFETIEHAARREGIPASQDRGPCDRFFFAAPSRADELHTLMVGGQRPQLSRSHPPPGWQPETPGPVVVALHGMLQSEEALNSYLGLNQVADREGFAVIYPHGLGNAWKDRRAPQLRMTFWSPPGDDVGVSRKTRRNALRKTVRRSVAGLSHGHLEWRLHGVPHGLRAA